MNLSFKNGLIFNPNTDNLRKYFWDVDMSKEGNEYGIDLKLSLIHI